MAELKSLKGRAWGVTTSKRKALKFQKEQRKMGIKTRIRKSKGPFKFRIYKA